MPTRAILTCTCGTGSACASGPVEDVWTYRVREKVDHVPPAPRYLRVMVQAGLEHGFPDGYLDQLRGVGRA